MKQFARILFEGAMQAWQQLSANKLRSFFLSWESPLAFFA